MAHFLPRADRTESRQVDTEVVGVELAEAVDVVGVEGLEIVVEILFDVDGDFSCWGMGELLWEMRVR